MLRKSLVLLGLCFLLPLAYSQSAGQIDRAAAIGQWNNSANPNEKFRLQADGRFSLEEHGQHLEGTWELQGNALLLHFGNGVGVAQWNGRAFVDDEHKNWVRAAPAAESTEILTNDDIAKMVAARMSPAKIIQMIDTQPGNYSVTPDGIANLKQQGVPEDVVSAMSAKMAVSPAIAPTTAKPQGAADASACPSGNGAYYFEAGTWKPMSQVMAEGSSASSRPIPFATSAKGVARYRGAAAPVMTASTPTFCISASGIAVRNLLVATLDVKSDHREIQTVRISQFGGAKTGIPDNKLVAVDVRQVSDQTVQVSVKRPLAPGQYMIFPMGEGYLGYDFGVAKNPGP